jgi:malic enzyme
MSEANESLRWTRNCFAMLPWTTTERRRLEISVAPTKGLTNQHDLALAYSPGVTYACLAIHANPQEAAYLTLYRAPT